LAFRMKLKMNFGTLFKQLSCQIWTSATLKAGFHVNCMSGSRDNVLQRKWWDLAIKSRY
jgi:hypothetical protein